MNVPKACELALRDGFIAAGISATYRCFRLDDLPLEATEPIEPTDNAIVEITAAQDTPFGYLDPRREVPVVARILTYHEEDPKHPVLTARETSIRDNLESEAFSSQFTVATGVTYVGIVIDGGSQPIVDENMSIIELSFNLQVCADWAS